MTSRQQGQLKMQITFLRDTACRHVIIARLLLNFLLLWNSIGTMYLLP